MAVEYEFANLESCLLVRTPVCACLCRRQTGADLPAPSEAPACAMHLSELIGEALGAILPKELLENMNVGQDDELLVVPADEGILLMPCNSNFEEAMEAFEVGREKYYQALRELAK